MKLLVRVTLLPERVGGRRAPLPQRTMMSVDVGATFRGHPVPHDARMTLVGVPAVSPGDSAQAVLEPLHPDLWAKVDVGAVLLLREGRHVRGEAAVLELTRSQTDPSSENGT